MSGPNGPIKRVLVLGAPGAGKSTFARALGVKIGAPVVHLDQLYWEPGWIIADSGAFRRRCREAAAAERWVSDGTYSNTFDERIPHADRIYWFDRGRISCMIRVLRRIFASYGRVRSDMADGCPEKLDFAFLRYVWFFNATRRPRIVAALEQFGVQDRTLIIRSDRDAQMILDAFTASGG